MTEKKQPKIAIIGKGSEAEAQVALLKEKMGDDVILVDGDSVTDFNAPKPFILTCPEMYDPRIVMDDDWSSISRSDRRGTNAKVRDSKVDPKIQRNAPCPCQSGKKYKKCCGNVK